MHTKFDLFGSNLSNWLLSTDIKKDIYYYCIDKYKVELSNKRIIAVSSVTTKIIKMIIDQQLRHNGSTPYRPLALTSNPHTILVQDSGYTNRIT